MDALTLEIHLFRISTYINISSVFHFYSALQPLMMERKHKITSQALVLAAMISCFNKLNFNSHKKQVIKSLFALHFRAQFFPLPVCNVSKLNLVPTSQADFQMFLNKYQIFGRFFASLQRIKCKNIAVGLPAEWY